MFGNVLERIILYGSVAKRTQTAESDVDIAVIVRRYTEDMHDKMIDFTVDLELEYNKVLSVLLIDYDNFREWEDVLPLYKNRKKDDIMLWSAA
ncbi:MAG: nucleotidyltransferase domain-containing protein [Lachnospiraceae bacterium]|nr:nucleotidyltransferase domain-containing protein [Lachnospiraceae bacterium]MDE7008276.1 nucleotidyltransferase domain-containing protein [Lachnospiraceae bacterium]